VAPRRYPAARRVWGEARVFDHALVFGDAQVFDNALVGGNATVLGSPRPDRWPPAGPG
jgi:hypothetical protein